MTTRKKKETDVIAEGSEQKPVGLALQNICALQGPEANIINHALIGSGCLGIPLWMFPLTPFNFLKLHATLGSCSNVTIQWTNQVNMFNIGFHSFHLLKMIN